MSIPTLTELTSKKCVPCEGGVPPLEPDVVDALIRTVPGWTLDEDGKRIHRGWTARNFVAGLHFLDKVGELAEEEGHHPDLHLEGYRNVAIEITTHAIGGLSENDFILAAKINAIPIEVKRS
ncbi:4a-hydroxytetrahydrobiopterin dehydratase [Planctomyces sp. SH-PL62]|uniref:4a-hydroxytetrahydrobiopterin dehydratase n=1 Tax=Planctomyces sp. SH-PL62 TaxID=1636152 RepID=UPI00078B3585|nr:4a-hydroxytetrahydrobiopterin dehydratase [Planctomyces sp. SH-PL62]AMV39701.1 Putative pterin-4-alpha-carbinolamine dehydratase [Planctomyces sp. SH-PL62]